MICTFDSYYNAENGKYVVGRYKSMENAYVDNVKLCGTLNNQDPRRACITFRVPVGIIILHTHTYTCVCM